MVGPERLIEKIRDAVQAKKLQGISDVTDLTDRNHGLRVAIGVKTGFDPNAVLEQLYRPDPRSRTRSASTTSHSSTASRAPSA